MSEKFTLIHEEKANHTILLMTGLLGVSRAGYYAWLARLGQVTPSQERRDRVATLVAESHEQSRQVNGYRRVRADLARQGVPVSEGMVRARMRDAGIWGVQPRSKKRTTIPADDAALRPDLIKRDFTAQAPGEKLVGDITYLRTGEGWLYLATVIDLYSRMVVGWSMAGHMRTELIENALEMAHTHGRIAPGAVFHSDRGSVYTSADYAATAGKYGVRLSVGRTGSCHDNAVAESFFSMLKNEMYHRAVFATRRRARFAVHEYIEVFYNRQRLHSTLGYRTPAQAHAGYEPQVAAAA